MKAVLFDLDGTLTDSKEGIIKSVAYALTRMGEPTEGRLDQHTVVGPPLLQTFENAYGFSPEKAKKTYAYFQERYSTVGKFENRAFHGVHRRAASCRRRPPQSGWRAGRARTGCCRRA